jgi:hypothetical protein
MTRVTENDLFGRFFLGSETEAPFEGYYSTLECIRPLLGRSEWHENTTGTYINVAKNYNAVRLSFFCRNADLLPAVVDSFIKGQHLKQVSDPEVPHQVKISEGYQDHRGRHKAGLETSSSQVLFFRTAAAR